MQEQRMPQYKINFKLVELYILEGYKVLDDTLIFTGECEKGLFYTVEYSIEDFRSFLGYETLEPNEEGIDWTDHAQDIHEAWRTRPTSYEVTVSYKFSKDLPF